MNKGWFIVRIDWTFNVISMLIMASTFIVYFNIWHQCWLQSSAWQYLNVDSIKFCYRGQGSIIINDIVSRKTFRHSALTTLNMFLMPFNSFVCYLCTLFSQYLVFPCWQNHEVDHVAETQMITITDNNPYIIKPSNLVESLDDSSSTPLWCPVVGHRPLSWNWLGAAAWISQPGISITVLIQDLWQNIFTCDCFLLVSAIWTRNSQVNNDSAVCLVVK